MKNKKDFQIAWAKAVNDKENHPYKDEVYGSKCLGKISARHYIMYNAIRGLRLDRGFEKAKHIKISGYASTMYGGSFEYIVASIDNIVKRHTMDIGRPFCQRKLEADLSYFGVISIEEFKELWDEALRIYNCS